MATDGASVVNSLLECDAALNSEALPIDQTVDGVLEDVSKPVAVRISRRPEALCGSCVVKTISLPVSHTTLLQFWPRFLCLPIGRWLFRGNSFRTSIRGFHAGPPVLQSRGPSGNFPAYSAAF